MRRLLMAGYWIICIIITMLMFSSISSAIYESRFNDYLVSQKGNTDVYASFLGYTNTNETVFNGETEDNTIKIYNGLYDYDFTWYNTEIDINGKESEVEITSEKLTRAYYIFLVNPDFSHSDILDSNNINMSPSAIRFYSGEKYFDYYLEQCSSFNSYDTIKANDKLSSYENQTLYISKPHNATEAIMGAERKDIYSVANSLAFIEFSIHEDLVNAINDKLGSTITSFAFVDDQKQSITALQKYDFAFDFSEEYYSDFKAIYESYSFLDAVEKDTQKYTKSMAKAKLSEFSSQLSNSNVYIKSSDEFKTSFNELSETLLAKIQSLDANASSDTIFDELNMDLSELTGKIATQVDVLIESQEGSFANYQKVKTQGEIVDITNVIIITVVICVSFLLLMGVVFFCIFWFDLIKKLFTKKKKDEILDKSTEEETEEIVIEDTSSTEN